jgi:Kef-type K+ transport system membrane component KefB
MIIGAGMIPRGEVGLIFCQNGLSANALSEKLYACGIIVIILSTLIGPVFLKLLYSIKKEEVYK